MSRVTVTEKDLLWKAELIDCDAARWTSAHVINAYDGRASHSRRVKNFLFEFELPKSSLSPLS